MPQRVLFAWSTLALGVVLAACESGDHIRIIDRSGGSSAYSGTGGSGADDPLLAGEPTPRTDGCPDDAPLAPNRVRIWPADGQAATMVGAKIQGSNAGPTTGFVDLLEITSAPTQGQFTLIDFDNTQRYRYLRYYAAPGSQGGLAELEFYYGNRRIQGTAFGTAVEPNAFSSALDGDPTTFFAGTASDGDFVGIDIAGTNVAQPVTFSPSTTSSTTPFDLTLSSATSSAAIHYTINADNPTATVGTLYTAAIHLDNGTWQIRAIAYADCMFDSEMTSVTYVVDPNANGL